MKTINLITFIAILLFTVGNFVLSQSDYNQKNVKTYELLESVALASHECDGESCHAYDVNGTIKCDACCESSGTAECSRHGGCGCI